MPGKRLLLTVITALALLWPAYVNGGPFWFPDTSNYIRAADAALVYASGSPSEWSDRLQVRAESKAVNAASADAEIQRDKIKPTRTVLTGRSIYYGFLVYLPMRMAGLWGGIALQALLTAALIILCGGIALRGRAPPGPTWVAGALTALILLTPLPYYTSMLMPDVYSGLIVLCLATLIVFWTAASRSERAVLLVACAAMASFHTTHLLLTAATGCIAAILYLPARRAMRPLAIAMPVLLAGIVAEMLFTWSVSHALHVKPISPPFLSARLTAAGPGTAFLKRHCPENPHAWALCGYVPVLPLESDSFLWSEDARSGVFQIADPSVQRRLSKEDKRFGAAVFTDDPMGVIGNSISSTFQQMVAFELDNFNYPRSKVAEIPAKYPPAVARAILDTRAAQDTMPVSINVIATTVATLGGVVLLGWLIGAHYTGRQPLAREQVLFASLLLIGVLANAAICGGLSGPHARYQMRLIWLVPYAAMLLGLVRARIRAGAAIPAMAWGPS